MISDGPSSDRENSSGHLVALHDQNIQAPIELLPCHSNVHYSKNQYLARSSSIHLSSKHGCEHVNGILSRCARRRRRPNAEKFGARANSVDGVPVQWIQSLGRSRAPLRSHHMFTDPTQFHCRSNEYSIENDRLILQSSHFLLWLRWRARSNIVHATRNIS